MLGVNRFVKVRNCDQDPTAWPDHPQVESIATDGFLFPNAVLAERGIAMRKGFPAGTSLLPILLFMLPIVVRSS